jgi:hypothetical protein
MHVPALSGSTDLLSMYAERAGRRWMRRFTKRVHLNWANAKSCKPGSPLRLPYPYRSSNSRASTTAIDYAQLAQPYDLRLALRIGPLSMYLI